METAHQQSAVLLRSWGRLVGMGTALEKWRRGDSKLQVEEQQQGSTVASPGSPGTDVSGAVVSCVNAVLGSGVLALPFAFRSTGVILGLLLIACGAFASSASLALLASSRHRLGFSTYEEGAELAAGAAGRSATSASVLLLQAGALVACINILADIASATASSIIPPSLDPERPAIKAITVGCALLPICLLVSSGHSLAGVSYASVGLVILFSLNLVWFAAYPIPEEPTASAASTAVAKSSSMVHIQHNKHSLTMWNSRGALIALPVVLFGFTAHVALLPVLNSLKKPSAPRIRRVLNLSVLLCTVIYTTVGWAGYAAFGRRTAGNVLRNFEAPNAFPTQQIAMRLMKGGIGASILFTVPLVVVPMRETGIAILERNGIVSSTIGTSRAQQLLTVAYLFAAQAFAIAVPNVELVFALIGATSSVMLGYVLPAIIFCNAFPADQNGSFSINDSDKQVLRLPRKAARIMAISLALLGTIVAGACTYETLEQVHEERLVADLARQVIAKSEAAASAAEAYTSAAGDNAVSLSPELQTSGVAEAQQAMESVGGSLGQLKANSDFREAARLLTVSSSGLDNTLARLDYAKNRSTSRRLGPSVDTTGQPGKNAKDGTAELMRMARERATGALERIRSVSSVLSRLQEKRAGESNGGEEKGDSGKQASLPSSSGDGAGNTEESKERASRSARGSNAPISAARQNGTGSTSAEVTSREVIDKLDEAQKALERSERGTAKEGAAYAEATEALKMADKWAQRHGKALNATRGRSVNKTAGTVAAASGVATEAVAKDLRRVLDPSNTEPEVLNRVKEIASAVGGDRVKVGFEVASEKNNSDAATFNAHSAGSSQQPQQAADYSEQQQANLQHGNSEPA